MKYEVTGFLKLSNEDKFDEHVEEFTDYNDAVDCYTEVFSNVAGDICNTGGEFVIMLTKHEHGEVTMLRRHTIGTTCLS